MGTEKIDAKTEKGNLDILKKSSLLNQYYNQIAEQDEKRALIVKKFFRGYGKEFVQCLSSNACRRQVYHCNWK